MSSAQVQVGVVTFASTVEDNFPLNAYTKNRNALLNAIDFNCPGGTTNMQAALAFTQNTEYTAVSGSRAGILKIAIAITDGYSDVLEGSSPMANAAAMLKSSGAIIYTIGVSSDYNSIELSNIATSPPATYTSVLASTNSSDISTCAQNILQKLCSP